MNGGHPELVCTKSSRDLRRKYVASGNDRSEKKRNHQFPKDIDSLGELHNFRCLPP